jgi:hypothetical protein
MKRLAGISSTWPAGAEQGAEVGLVDLAGHLHGAAGEADLVADDLPAAGHLQRHPGAAHAVAVGDGHLRKASGKMLQRHPRALGLVELGRELLDQGVVEHGFSPG